MLTQLLLLPLAPVRAAVWVAEHIQDQVDRERNDRGTATGQLADIDAAWRAGEITDARRDELEEQVLQGLYGEQAQGGEPVG